MFTSILTAILVLSFLILVHELGHFIAAKRSGVYVEEFGIGLPPRVFGKKIGETIYSINLLPFGGFVRLHGESSEEKIKYPKRSFLKKDKKTRIKIITAGVIMNFILGIIAFSITYSFSGIPKDIGQVKVVEIMQNSPAQISGLLVGDIIRKVEDKDVIQIDEFIDLVNEKLDKKVFFEIERNVTGEKEVKKIRMTPRSNPPENEGPLGVVITSTENYYPPIWQRPFVGIYYGLKEAIFWGWAILQGLFSMVSGLISGKVPQDVSGPVGVFAITAEAAKYGILSLINFIGIFSINLAILNIVPFPALDGGKILFIGIEAVTGKKVLPKIENIIHAIGMVILIILLIALTARDIQRLISAGSISGFLDSVVK
ncbi:RIP metalloprotease [Patescibacteria group bacterium]